MDIISLGKANKTLKDIEDLSQQVIGPHAESHFKNVAKRLDWIEEQSSSIYVNAEKDVDLSKGIFVKTEFTDGKVQLKKLSDSEYEGKGSFESGLVDLGDSWKNISSVEVVSKSTNLIHINDIFQSGSTRITASANPNQSWHVFNGSKGSYWYVNGSRPPEMHWIKYDFGEHKGKVVNGITLAASSITVSSHGIKNWVFYGSTDDVTYIELARGLHPNDKLDKTYIFENKEKYRFYRLNLDSYYNSSSASIAEMTLLGYESIKDIYISVSDDGINFSEPKVLIVDSIPQKRFLKFSGELNAPLFPGDKKSYSFNQSDSEHTYILNEFVKADGSLGLNNTHKQYYETEFEFSGSGTLLSSVLDKKKFRKIISIE